MQIAATYEQAAERRFPEQITIAIARDADGKHNPITISWTMLTSIEPPMMAISVGKIFGFLKPQFKSKTYGTKQDFGVITVDIAQ